MRGPVSVGCGCGQGIHRQPCSGFRVEGKIFTASHVEYLLKKSMSIMEAPEDEYLQITFDMQKRLHVSAVTCTTCNQPRDVKCTRKIAEEATMLRE